MDPTVWDAQEYLRWPHSTTGEPAMAGGKVITAANTGTAIPAIPIETKHTKVNYMRSRTR